MTTTNLKILTSATFLALVGMILPAWADGFLYVGSDTEEFGAQPLPDKIGKYQTNGATIVGGANIPLGTDDFANGMTIVGGNLLTGTVTISDLTFRDLNTVPTGAPINADTPDASFNEDLAYDGTSIWRAYFGDCVNGLITELDPNNLSGPALNVYTQAFGVVGMTSINGQLWTTDWCSQTVGTFDPSTNTYTPVFNTSAFGNSGCLAWDNDSQVLWVGTQNGWVVPYDMTGVQQGPAFQPFGDTDDTIDGCTITQPVEAEKTWTFTDYNWDPVCTQFDSITGECIATRPANINDPADNVLADPLPQDGDDNYLLNAVVHKEKFQNTNPGAFYALTTVVINNDLDTLTVVEDYSDCYDNQGLIQFVSNPETRNVKVAVAAPNGDVTEITGDIYDGTGGSITSIDHLAASIEITDSSHLTAGSTVYVLVKFQDDLKGDAVPGNVFDESCVNSESVDTEIDGVSAGSVLATAGLRITTSP